MTAAPVVLLATCAEVADLDADSRALADALRARGADVRPAVWDAEVDWAAADLVVVRSTWDYVPRREEYLAWAARVAAVTRLENPPDLLRWSTDKAYLEDLRAAGLPVVPSAVLAPGDGGDHPFLGVEHVVKPTVSAGSKDTLRLGADAEGARRSADHVLALHAEGRTALVQPYLAAVDDDGETAVVCADGEVVHAVRKGPLLERGGGRVEGLFAEENISARTAAEAELEVARAALDVVRGRTGRAPLYARVDLLPSEDGPVLLELELAEPSLFLDVTPGAADAVAAAVLRRVAG
ncbi:ATP-grasp domain-containing protein [Pseudokineococcus lusitanus]|uniref:ATP-grasp domain-containing protein n=1 Tax=Pseudokineococcus lusitanus TaxID=763993 RepID=A0A3N1HQB1_9ACTN|nr:hypothetical protein [Pseudokineococcus lusitanus]ROP44703.1 hypothetical protein EDC03_0829 [Pseudokineococcus lusitanus]